VGFAERLRTVLDSACPEVPGRLGFAAWDLGEQDPVTLDAERPVHPASTIKVLILVAALREVQRGRWALDSDVPLLPPGDRAGGSGVLRELTSVYRMSLSDLLTLMIVVSDNAATNAVIDVVGFDAINACARDLGCTETRVERRLMDPGARGENVTSALDQARVLDGLARGTALPADLSRHALDVLSRQQVRDRLPALLPPEARCWNKTGELLGLRHDVGLIGTDSAPRAVVAVLVDELTDDRSRLGYRGGPACDAIAAVGLAVHQALT
jgi:beta-lactamase class A